MELAYTSPRWFAGVPVWSGLLIFEVFVAILPHCLGWETALNQLDQQNVLDGIKVYFFFQERSTSEINDMKLFQIKLILTEKIYQRFFKIHAKSLNTEEDLKEIPAVLS